jgi:hypothetical protein
VRRPGLVSLALPFVFAATYAAHARADDGSLPLDLDWRAPPECADGEQVRAELARIAHVRPGRIVPRLSARGRIEKSGANYRLSLRTERSGDAGERTLVATECRSLEREVTLVLAVAFGEGVEIVEPAPDSKTPGGTAAAGSTADGDPRSQAKAEPAQAPAKPEAKAAPASGPSAEPEPRATPGASARGGSAFRAAFFAGGGADIRTLPSLAAFATLGAELGTERYWVEPHLTWLPRVEGTLARDVRTRYSGAGGAVLACLGLPAGSLRVAACAGAEATALFGHSTGATESGDATAPLYTGNGALSLEWPRRSMLAIRFDAALKARLNDPRFVVEGLGEAHRVPFLLPEVSAALVWAPVR